MKRIFLFVLLTMISCKLIAQRTLKTWDGGGGNNRWDNAANWQPDGVPGFDSIILDNRAVTGNYQVVFPDTALGRVLWKIMVSPDSTRNRRIQLILPSTNRATLAVQAANIELTKGAVLRHSGGAEGREQLSILGSFKVKKGAEYIHNTGATHNFFLLEFIELEGSVLFNVPASSYYINLRCLCNMRKVTLDASAAPAGAIEYTSDVDPAATDTFIIATGSTYTMLNSTRLQVANLVINGTLNLDASSREFSLLFKPYDGAKHASLSGSGTLRTGVRRIDYNTSGDITMHLRRNLDLNDALHSFNLNPNSTLDMGSFLLTGVGGFRMFSNSKLQIGSPDGIWASHAFGNIRTLFRFYNANATYEYTSSGLQHTGDGLPADVKQIILNKPSGELLLTRSTIVRSNIKLLGGKLKTTADKLLTYSGDNDYGSPENLYGDHYGWEQSFIDGPVAIVFPSAGHLRIFPVGKGNTFAPFIVLKRNAGNITYTGEYFPETYPGVTAVNSSLHHISRIEYWTLRSSSATTATDAADDASLFLTWRPMSRIGFSLADRRNLRIARYENSDFRLRWEAQPLSGTVGTPSGFLSDYTAFLPTLVTDFSPQYFTLGSLTEANPMFVLDPLPVTRRGQTIMEEKANAVLYPNPVQHVLNVNIADASTLEIINPAGQIVKKQFGRTGNISRVDMSGLPAGTYFLRVFNNAEQHVYPFVKQ